MTTLALSRDLQADRLAVNRHLEHLLHSSNPHPSSRVHEAMCYSVLGSAQRIRPLLALRVARMLGAETQAVLRAAAAVELLHCASLIVDDLPCMDDEKCRRGRETVHIVFGEATAVLSAFSLVAMAARTSIDPLASRDRLPSQMEFQDALLRTLDCGSLVDGQALDLTLSVSSAYAERRRVNELKTVPLFQLAVHAGSISADPSPEERRALCQFGMEFGVAFQIMDDYLDDGHETPESLEMQFQRSRDCLAPFHPASLELEGIFEYLHAKAGQKNRRHR